MVYWLFVEMPFSPRSKSLHMFSDEVSESTSIDGEEAVVGTVSPSIQTLIFIALVMSALGFKAKGESLTCMLHWCWVMDSSDSSLV